MTHTLKTTIEKQKLQAFLSIKSYSKRKFRRTNSPRAKSSTDKIKYEYKSNQRSACTTWYRPNSSSKSYTSTKKVEISDLFSRVKFIANNLTQANESNKKFLGKHDQNSRKANS